MDDTDLELAMTRKINQYDLTKINPGMLTNGVLPVESNSARSLGGK